MASFNWTWKVSVSRIVAENEVSSTVKDLCDKIIGYYQTHLNNGIPPSVIEIDLTGVGSAVFDYLTDHGLPCKGV